MKDRKGQALVEFVLIIPIIVIIIFGMVELGNMIHKKYMVETYMDVAIDLYRENKKEVIDSYASSNDISISFEESGSIVKVTIIKKVKTITPGTNIITGNPYIITSTRSFYKDTEVNPNE